MASKTTPAWGTPAWVEQYIEKHGFPPIAGGDDGATEDGGDAGDGASGSGDDGSAGAGAGSGSGDDSGAAGTGAAGGDDAGTGDGDDAGSTTDWKAEARKHEDRSKSHKARADKAEADLKKIQDANKSEQQKAIDDAVNKAKSETATGFRTSIAQAEVKAAATGMLEYPDTAWDLLKLDVDKLFDEDNEIDSKQITEAIEKLLKDRPKLAAGAASKTSGGADGGKGSKESPSQEDMSVEDHLKDVQTKK